LFSVGASDPIFIIISDVVLMLISNNLRSQATEVPDCLISLCVFDIKGPLSYRSGQWAFLFVSQDNKVSE
jgi:hypothetical protein